MNVNYKLIRDILTDVRHYLFRIEECMSDEDDLSEVVKDNTSNIINITKVVDTLADSEIGELRSEIHVKAILNSFHGGYTHVDTDSIKEDRNETI